MLPANRWKTGGKTAGKLPEATGKTVGKTAGKPLEKPLENRWKTVGRPLAKLPEDRPETAGKRASNRWKNRWKTAGGPLAKTVGKPPKTAGESPVFGSLLPSLNKQPEWLERVSPTSFFGPWGGVAIRNPLFRLKVCTLRSYGVGGTGIYGFLDVTKGLLGPMTAFAGFH